MRWLTPLIFLGLGIVCWLFTGMVGRWGSCGPNGTGLTFFLIGLFLVPASLIWLLVRTIRSLYRRKHPQQPFVPQ